MRSILTGLLTAALALGVAGTANAQSKTYRTYTYYTYVDDDSPSAIAKRQRHARTFDETEYYERDSRKIPFGTAEWWRQMDREGGGRRR
jgi:hypothetical protein